jgi:hypothetical protein
MNYLFLRKALKLSGKPELNDKSFPMDRSSKQLIFKLGFKLKGRDVWILKEGEFKIFSVYCYL